MEYFGIILRRIIVRFDWRVRRGTGSAVRLRRAMGVLASAGGNTVSAIARLVQGDEDAVREVIHRFNEMGLAVARGRCVLGQAQDSDCSPGPERVRLRLHDAYGNHVGEPGCIQHAAEEWTRWDHGGEVEIEIVPVIGDAATATTVATLGAELLREENSGVPADPPDHATAGTTASTSGDEGFGGHEFEYEQETDLFGCTECTVYEVTARDANGSITPCTGLVGYGGDTERVYLLLTENPALPYSHVASLATIIRSTGIGRAPRFSWRDGRLLVESAPSVVAELASRIAQITFTVDGRQVPAVSSVEHPTAEAGRAIIVETRGVRRRVRRTCVGPPVS